MPKHMRPLPTTRLSPGNRRESGLPARPGLILAPAFFARLLNRRSSVPRVECEMPAYAPAAAVRALSTVRDVAWIFRNRVWRKRTTAPDSDAETDCPAAAQSRPGRR